MTDTPNVMTNARSSLAPRQAHVFVIYGQRLHRIPSSFDPRRYSIRSDRDTGISYGLLTGV